MVDEELLSGLRVAISHNSSLEQAILSFINSGYNPKDVREAADILSQQQSQQAISAAAQQTLPKEKPKSSKKLIYILIILLAIIITSIIFLVIFWGDITNFISSLFS